MSMLRLGLHAVENSESIARPRDRLAMVAQAVPSQRELVNPARPGREPRSSMHRVPGCGCLGGLQFRLYALLVYA